MNKNTERPDPSAPPEEGDSYYVCPDCGVKTYKEAIDCIDHTKDINLLLDICSNKGLSHDRMYEALHKVVIAYNLVCVDLNIINKYAIAKITFIK